MLTAMMDNKSDSSWDHAQDLKDQETLSFQRLATTSTGKEPRTPTALSTFTLARAIDLFTTTFVFYFFLLNLYNSFIKISNPIISMKHQIASL